MTLPPTSDHAPVRGARPGRPRSVAADQAILRATREVLATAGYSGLTMEHVAARAGVAKTTLYRRWPTKNDLVVDAVVEPMNEVLTLSGAGTPEDGLRLLVQALSSPTARAAHLALIAETARDEALSARVREALFEPARVVVARLAADAGCTDDPALVFSVVVGAVTHRVLMLQEPADDDFVHGLLALVTRPAVD
ncbi:MAG TPA: TetR/AcrR family transcriptional regulator [Candidatus Limnocylindria bacterium]|nr:TetR/AcrR family transcriptional regulator [Candidatus Limnocylindria bacterium]